jgi:hypothetical protein
MRNPIWTANVRFRPEADVQGGAVRLKIAVRHSLCVVAIGFVIGLFEGASPNGDPAGAFRTWAAGNVAFTFAVAILFFAVATQNLTESLR